MSGIFDTVKDVFGGGAEKKAAKAQVQGVEKGIEANERAQAQAREDLFKLFPSAQQNAQQGFQGALDVFGQTIPQQGNVFQQGNVGAQQQLLGGLQQSQNALLGGQVDLSQLQPTQLNTDFGFAQQQLPQFIDPYAQAPQPMGPQQNPNLLAGNAFTPPDQRLMNGNMRTNRLFN